MMFWYRFYACNILRGSIIRSSTNVARTQSTRPVGAVGYRQGTYNIEPKHCTAQTTLSFNKVWSKVGNVLMFSSESSTEEIDHNTFESVCEETLDSLCEFFEDIVERKPIFKTADVCFGDGVLTVNLDKYGTYVINRQSPNKQIWLSSPISGPKRYDFVPRRNGWVYRHDNKTLHGLLQEELSSITNSPIDLSICNYCGDFK